MIMKFKEPAHESEILMIKITEVNGQPVHSQASFKIVANLLMVILIFINTPFKVSVTFLVRLFRWLDSYTSLVILKLFGVVFQCWSFHWDYLIERVNW